jgi:magnesium transporter
MNFAGSPYNMPELAWTFGYPAVMLGMGAMVAIILAQFRRQGWL